MKDQNNQGIEPILNPEQNDSNIENIVENYFSSAVKEPGNETNVIDESNQLSNNSNIDLNSTQQIFDMQTQPVQQTIDIDNGEVINPNTNMESGVGQIPASEPQTVQSVEPIVNTENIETINNNINTNPVNHMELKPNNIDIQSIQPQPVVNPASDQMENVQPVAPIYQMDSITPVQPLNQDYEEDSVDTDVNGTKTQINEHPDAIIRLNNKEEEEIAKVSTENLKFNLKENKSLMFVLILGIALFIIIMLLPVMNSFIS